ncbi:MAG: glycerophosphodiester phosphodiesterase [Anaerolineae bacterium]
MLDYIYRGRQLNLAHRGARMVAPENTLAAFRAALEMGADGIELDVQLSADGAIVVHHDFDLGRTNNGAGPLKRQTLAQLKRLDAGSWRDAEFARERIPTLAEVFQLLDRQMVVNVELKTRSFFDDGLEKAVVEEIKRSHMVDKVILSSFNPRSLMRVRSISSQLPLGLLYSPDQPIHLRRAWLRRFVRPEALHPRFDMVDQAFMQEAKAEGYRVNVWTVNEVEDMERLLKLKVDAIITDRPNILRQVMTNMGLAPALRR